MRSLAVTGMPFALKNDDIPIGYVNVSTDDSHDLGYGLQKRFWRQGIVREATQAVVEQVKKDGLLYITQRTTSKTRAAAM